MAINQLTVLDANDLWVEIRDIPATPIDCSFTGCQNVVRGAHYEVTGDLHKAKNAAIVELMGTWVPTADTDPFDEDSIHFQLRDDIEIDTTTDTAFLRASFAMNLQVGADAFVANAIIITLSSDDEI